MLSKIESRCAASIMKKEIETVLSFLLRFGLSALLLGYLFTKIDTESLLEVLRSANVTYILLALFVFLIIHFFILVRWLMFIRALGLDIPPGEITRYFFIGLFGNLFLPSAIGGDIIKAIGLCKNSDQKARVVASIALDRLSGFAAIVIVSVTVFILGYRIIGNNFLLVPILALAACSGLIVLILFNTKVFSFMTAVFKKIPKIRDALMSLHNDISLIARKPKEGFMAVGLSCFTQILLAITFFLIARALHQDINIIYFFIFVPLICVVSSLPSIGGLGVRDMGAAYLFGRIGVESGIAVSITLLNFIFMVFIGLVGGIIYVVTFSSRRVQHPSPRPGVAVRDS